MDGFHFATDVRVRFAETDAQGVVHNSNYLVWFELARIDYLERSPAGTSGCATRGSSRSCWSRTSATSRRRCSTTGSSCTHAATDVRGARFRFEYAITRDGIAIADGWTLHGTVDAVTLRPTRMPAWLRRRDRYC